MVSRVPLVGATGDARIVRMGSWIVSIAIRRYHRMGSLDSGRCLPMVSQGPLFDGEQDALMAHMRSLLIA